MLTQDVPAAEPTDEIGLFEMANLSPDQIGVEGVIDISSAQASHGPRVKWYPARPGAAVPCLSVTIEPRPQAFNHRLQPRVFRVAADRVTAWVALNHVSLADFWYHGATWMDDEVADFKKELKKLI